MSDKDAGHPQPICANLFSSLSPSLVDTHNHTTTQTHKHTNTHTHKRTKTRQKRTNTRHKRTKPDTHKYACQKLPNTRHKRTKRVRNAQMCVTNAQAYTQRRVRKAQIRVTDAQRRVCSVRPLLKPVESGTMHICFIFFPFYSFATQGIPLAKILVFNFFCFPFIFMFHHAGYPS